MHKKNKNAAVELPTNEFIILIALMTALLALSIDIMLPALPNIGAEFNILNANDNQLVISVLFIGIAIGKLIYGPISDSTGRKPAINFGMALFIIGSLLAIMATDYSVLLVGRVLQGFGLAAPSVVCFAIVRDRYNGRSMARVMSFVKVVFVFVPMIAPAIGQWILLVAHWKLIFIFLLVFALIMLIWFSARLDETLSHDMRRPFSFKRIQGAAYEVFKCDISLGYTIIIGLISGSFLGYLTSAQQIFQIQYELGAQFPLFFAISSLSIGCAAFINGKLVMSLGMQRISQASLITIQVASLAYFSIINSTEGGDSLLMLMIYLMIILFCIGLLIGNLNALAMEPLGHIAGVGASVIGSVSTFISVFLGVSIGQSYDGTVIPLVFSFFCVGALSFIILKWSERSRLLDQECG